MARQFDMCDVCKLDKEKICSYECIKKHSDFMFRFFTCPNFIYDNGEPMNYAELISTDLKEHSDLAAKFLWNKLIVNKEFESVEMFQEWLKNDAYLKE